MHRGMTRTLANAVLALIAVLALAACENQAAPSPETTEQQGFVATPAPPGPGTEVPAPGPNQVLDPEQTPVAITGLTVDETGHEIVYITNISEESHQIGGWAVFNRRTERSFVLPPDLTIEPGQVVRVHSGPGGVDNPPGDFLWSEERQWSEAREDVLLVNQAGRLMYWYSASTS